MRQISALIVATMLLSSCGSTNIDSQADDYAGQGEIRAPAPATRSTSTGTDTKNPDAESWPVPKDEPAPGMENVAPVEATDPTPPVPQSPATARFVDLATGDGVPRVRMSVLRDRMTGCEYVVTSLNGEEIDISRRSEAGKQRCAAPATGAGYIWIGAPLAVTVSTVRDTQTGCDYIVGTMYGQTSFIEPRMIRAGAGDTQPLCRVQGPAGQRG